MKKAYITKKFKKETLAIIEKANEIIEEYQAQGFSLTLRQIYYQFVARDLIPNKQSSYDRLGNIISDGRLAGHIDWNAIVDRTRRVRSNPHWSSAGHIIDTCVDQYREDLWANQDYAPEVWIEKDALVGVIEDVCNELDIPYFSCRGYTSQSEMHSSAMRLKRKILNGKTVKIFHLGDHDPSGIDMTRDIYARMELFIGNEIEYDFFCERFEVDRIALNMQQVIEFDPPPNPAKITDSRAGAYIAEHGSSSWELDALEPSYLHDLIKEKVDELINGVQLGEDAANQEHEREILRELAEEHKK